MRRRLRAKVVFYWTLCIVHRFMLLPLSAASPEKTYYQVGSSWLVEHAPLAKLAESCRA